MATAASTINGIALGRHHARRLRDLYRSAGWPSQDNLEVELLATGLLSRITEPSGHPKVQVTDAGIEFLAQAFYKNRQARSRHEALVELVAQSMQLDGRIVWTGLSLRAKLGSEPDGPNRWKICIPDVFSIRNTTVAGYLEPIVHEIKVNRSDLLGDLNSIDKRTAYLNVGGQCWYVLGCDANGRPIGTAEDVPTECGVMFAEGKRLHVERNAPKRSIPDLPFSMWMALAKATPMEGTSLTSPEGPSQSLLVELGGLGDQRNLRQIAKLRDDTKGPD